MTPKTSLASAGWTALNPCDTAAEGDRNEVRNRPKPNPHRRCPAAVRTRLLHGRSGSSRRSAWLRAALAGRPREHRAAGCRSGQGSPGGAGGPDRNRAGSGRRRRHPEHERHQEPRRQRHPHHAVADPRQGPGALCRQPGGVCGGRNTGTVARRRGTDRDRLRRTAGRGGHVGRDADRCFPDMGGHSGQHRVRLRPGRQGKRSTRTSRTPRRPCRCG